jgi:hypothetical protein
VELGESESEKFRGRGGDWEERAVVGDPGWLGCCTFSTERARD